ncbi:hypothetical protein BYT27DRAFT_7190690 [Phlegmacium glaucopus]|nr:hypothetical protein BYT27DRAFT_7190690 [Phlegmacium glaucopus]
MAQTTHALLLAESNSIEYVPRLSPPTPRTVSHSSTSSIDSGSNFFPQGEAVEGANQTSLPSFYPSGSRDATPSSNPDNSPRNWTDILFHGWRVVVVSWLNVLLVLIPLSWAMTLSMKNTHSLTFIFCVLALIPLVRLHDLSTRELSTRIGGAKTGLMNASMSNFVTIVVAISALRKCELRVVQSALIGSMLSKLLLVLGLCFFAGGMRFSEQGFDATATQIHSSLLSLSVGAVLLPAAYHFALDTEQVSSDVQKQNILHMSHGVSVVLLVIYISYLLFQLWSHSHLYDDQYDKKSSRLSSVIKEKNAHRKERRISMGRTESVQSDFSKVSDERLKDRTASFERTGSQPDFSKMVNDPSPSTLYPPRRPFVTPSPLSSSSDLTLSNATDAIAEKGVYFQTRPSTLRLISGTSVPMVRDPSKRSSVYSNAESTVNFSLDERSDHERSPPVVDSPSLPTRKEPQLSWTLTVLLLVLVTAAIALTVDRLVESMDAVSSTISKDWVGLILLPGISSVAECLSAVKVSVKDELTLSVSVAVGSTIQTALFVIPFTVILAWITHKPLSLLMDPFQSMVLYIAVQTMSYVVADGKSNWLEGVILVCLYIIIAVSFWFYPGSNLPLSVCVT